MATTLFFSAFMAVVIYFFVLAGNLTSPGAWIYAVFLFILFVQMLRTKKYPKYRRIFQAVFAVFFTISFIGTLYDERGSMSIAGETIRNSQIPFCQIVIPVIMIPWMMTKTIIFPARITGHFAAVISMLLIWFIVSLTIGRGWCGWVCFFGGWEDGVSRLAKKTRIDLSAHHKTMRLFQFAFFFFIVLVTIAFMSSVYCEWFCPFKLVTEYASITDIPGLIATVIFIGLFLGLVLVLPFLTRRRFQCSTLCPFGAFQSLIDRVSWYRITINTDKCTGCLKCKASCPFCAIDAETISGKKGRPEITCAKCGECIAACPAGAIRMELTLDRRKRTKEGVCGKPEPESRAGRILHELLDPQSLFVFTAFTFSVIISSRFVPDALMRIFGILA